MLNRVVLKTRIAGNKHVGMNQGMDVKSKKCREREDEGRKREGSK